MLSRFKVERYKSLFNVEVELEPLTVFIGPNGSGKSNICEALVVISETLKEIIESRKDVDAASLLHHANAVLGKNNPLKYIFPIGKLNYLAFEVSRLNEVEISSSDEISNLYIKIDFDQQIVNSIIFTENNQYSQSNKTDIRSFLVKTNYVKSLLSIDLSQVKIYDFSPTSINESEDSEESNTEMSKTGRGLAYALADLLLDDRDSFSELEKRLCELVPNIKRISLQRYDDNNFSLNLIDRYPNRRIPASEVSDGTLRILAFLTAIYQIETPSILCFEEIENGVHPWLLHKMMELLKLISTEGINGKPVQVLITTHSPILLNYVEPKQVRAVELDNEGKTQVHNLPIESKAFQKALDAYDGALGELWFTNVFGGNPE